MDKEQAQLPIGPTEKDVKKKYCNKGFKTHLSKALKTNQGEPGNLTKIMNNKVLNDYTPQKVISYTNGAAVDVQQDVNSSIDDPRMRELIKMTQAMDHICYGVKPQELPLLMKLQSNNDLGIDFSPSNEIQFDQLNKFLYAGVNGLVDFTEMNESTKKVLYDTFNLLMKQVEEDAPKFLEDFKSKIGTGSAQYPHPNLPEVSQIFQDKSLNPLHIPFEYMINGNIPNVPNEK